MAAARLDTSTDSVYVPQTETPSSVHEDSQKAVPGRMPLTSEKSVSQPEGSKFEKGHMSAARDSAESDRPTRRGPASGSEDRLSTLQKEDAEEFGEFLHEGKANASPRVRSFEEDARLKRPPPDFELSQEHWLGLHDGIREKLWRMYRLDNPSTMEDDEESSRMVEAIARARKERLENKAREDFEREHASKKEDLACSLSKSSLAFFSNRSFRALAMASTILDDSSSSSMVEGLSRRYIRHSFSRIPSCSPSQCSWLSSKSGGGRFRRASSSNDLTLGGALAFPYWQNSSTTPKPLGGENSFL